jgi:2-iminobutanoate/2-iminopropanoate deaminase
MALERVVPRGAPSPRGAYTPAIRAGDFIYVSGQGSIDPATDQFSSGDIKHQTTLTLSNIVRILEACGATVEDVVKCSVFLRDAGEFQQMNEAYSHFFGDHRPARTTVEAKFHVPEMRVEIDCVAYKPRA